MKKYTGPHAEIERKFLLKRLPSIAPLDTRKVTHHYADGIRYTCDLYEDGSVKYVKCIKLPLEIVGGNSEDETDISYDEFEKAIQGTPSIIKMRSLYDIDGYLWEIDYFLTVSLIVAEVEWTFPLDAIDMSQVDAFIVPESMKPLIIAEVTGIPGFANYNLAS